MRAGTGLYEHSRLKAEIVARVRAGETVTAICASWGGSPCAASVQVWRRGDAAFAAALGEARAAWDRSRRTRYDPGVGRAFVARVRGGERIRHLLGKPGMPSQRTYQDWRRHAPAFAEAMRRLPTRRYAATGGRGHPRWRDFDEATADRILLAVLRGAALRPLLASDRSLPCLAVLARWRRAEPDWDAGLKAAMRLGRLARGRTPARLTPALTEAVVEGIVMGGSLRSVAQDPAMPCARTLLAWARRSPGFAQVVAQACADREHWYIDQMAMICERNGPMRFEVTKRQVAPLQRQLNRLAKRPGWTRRRAADEAEA